jgi:hypothetical protein
MTTNPLYAVEQLPTTSAAAIREFNDRFIAGAGADLPPAWSTDIGELIPTNAPMVTFPVSALGLKYQRTQDGNRTKTMKEGSFDVKTEEFDEGIEAPLADLFQKVFAYRKWLDGPARLLNAEARHRNRSIVTLLEAGTTAVCFDGEFFFDTDHPCNIGDAARGTYSNYQSSTKDVVSLTNLEAECTLFMQNAKDEQGEKVDSKPDTIIVPTEKFMPLTNLLGQNLVPNSAGTATMNNPFYGGKFTVVHVPELTDVNDWYLLDSKRLKQAILPPWIMLRQMMPAALELRNYDESSDFFKDTGRIKVSSHVWWGFSLAFPHAIRLIKGA